MGALIEGQQHHRFEVVITEFAIGSAQLLKQELHHLPADIAGGLNIASRRNLGLPFCACAPKLATMPPGVMSTKMWAEKLSEEWSH